MDTEVHENSWVGQQIDDRFSLHEWLGSTDLGDVFRTELPGPQQAAILLASANDEGAGERLRNWQIAAVLDHPHLLRVFESGRAQVKGSDVFYVVTEMPEEALGQVLPERPLSPEEAREMLPPILDALAYLHGEGIVHGSLEPANILVVGDQLKLSPYALQPIGAALASNGRRPVYDAPETEGGPLTPAADIWSLGITIVEALTQRTPSWMRSSGHDPLVPVTVPQPLAEIARRCLRGDPAQRCSIAQIRQLLSTTAAPAVAGAAVPPISTATAAPRQLPFTYETVPETPRSQVTEAPRLRKSLRALEDDLPPRRFPLAIVLGAIAFLFVLVAGIVAYSHRDKPANSLPDDSTAGAPESPVKPPSGPTVKGEVAQRVVPEIPERAMRGIHGKVEVKIKVAVDHGGGVTNASILSDGRSRYFANLALEAARKWRFHPARAHGQPASSVWELHFVFRQDGTDITPVETAP
jgi:eukaryotic-like serine/threonine-protein kinase